MVAVATTAPRTAMRRVAVMDVAAINAQRSVADLNLLVLCVLNLWISFRIIFKSADRLGCE